MTVEGAPVRAPQLDLNFRSASSILSEPAVPNTASPAESRRSKAETRPDAAELRHNAMGGPGAKMLRLGCSVWYPEGCRRGLLFSRVVGPHRKRSQAENDSKLGSCAWPYPPCMLWHMTHHAACKGSPCTPHGTHGALRSVGLDLKYFDLAATPGGGCLPDCHTHAELTHNVHSAAHIRS